MKGDTIEYREGYKYQLCADYSVEVPIHPLVDISERFVKLTTVGLLTIRQDYAWDGPSGPTQDTPDGLRASLVHDALYQIMRERQLDQVKWRTVADSVFKELLVEDGMDDGRSTAWHRGVCIFGEPNANPANEKPTLLAPRPMEPYRKEWD